MRALRQCTLFASFLAGIALIPLLQACDGGGSPQEQGVQEAEDFIRSNGELASADTIKIGPPMVKHMWRYKLSFLVAEGTWVKTGQPIMGFDSQQVQEKLRVDRNALEAEEKKLHSQQLDDEAALEDIKLQLAETQMELKKAERKAGQNGDYMAQIEAKKLVLDLRIAEKSVLLAQYREQNRRRQSAVEQTITASEIARLQAEVKESEQAIANMKVKAPKEGIVVYLPNNDGNKPAEGDEIFFVQKVLELPNLSDMVVKTTIPEQQISRVAVGQIVSIKLDAVPERSFRGQVISLGQIVRVKSNQEPSMVFDALIAIDEPDTRVMRPGMAARLEIATGEAAVAATTEAR